MTADNPKEAAGRAKTPMSPVPANALMRIGAVLAHGAVKYGRHNWREAGINLSTYYDAVFRHLASWWEGEDNDPESGESHLAHVAASLIVAMDAIEQGMAKDDRPPASKVHPVTKERKVVKVKPFFEDRMAAEVDLRTGHMTMAEFAAKFPHLVRRVPTPTEQS